MPKFKTSQGTFDVPDSEVAEFKKDFPDAQPVTGEKKKVVVTAADQAAIKEKAAAKPSTVVSQEDYDRLVDLYKKGEAEQAKNPRKVSPATLEFQKLYHQILPEEAQRILASDPKATNWAQHTGKSQIDLAGNEDGLFGRRTKQYMERLQQMKPEAAKPAEPKLADTPPLADDKKPETPAGPDEIVVSHGEPEKERKLPPVAPAWWLQDKLKALNVGLNYLNIRPYYPWEPMAHYDQARPAFLSPERALAENQSQMNMQLGQLAQFSGPQAFNARANEITGKGFANAANTIAGVHNQNINIANQFEQFNTGIRNQETKENLAHATSLWDKYQATRQNFDNAKRMAGDALFNTAVQAVTNRANTYNLNQMYPQYAINPGDGGTMFFHDGRDLKPGQAPTPISERYKQMVKDNPTLANNTEGLKQLWEMTKLDSGIQDDYMAQYAKNRYVPNQQVPIPGYNG